MLTDERSVSPPEIDEKIALALELRQHCLAAGIPEERLIFDPLLPSLRSPEAWIQVGRTVETLRLLSTGAIFHSPVRTMIGLSNLRSGQKSKIDITLESTCLAMLAGAGLDFALLDTASPETVATADMINKFK